MKLNSTEINNFEEILLFGELQSSKHAGVIKILMTYYLNPMHCNFYH